MCVCVCVCVVGGGRVVRSNKSVLGHVALLVLFSEVILKDLCSVGVLFLFFRG